MGTGQTDRPQALKLRAFSDDDGRRSPTPAKYNWGSFWRLSTVGPSRCCWTVARVQVTCIRARVESHTAWGARTSYPMTSGQGSGAHSFASTLSASIFIFTTSLLVQLFRVLQKSLSGTVMQLLGPPNVFQLTFCRADLLSPTLHTNNRSLIGS